MYLIIELASGCWLQCMLATQNIDTELQGSLPGHWWPSINSGLTIATNSTGSYLWTGESVAASLLQVIICLCFVCCCVDLLEIIYTTNYCDECGNDTVRYIYLKRNLTFIIWSEMCLCAVAFFVFILEGRVGFCVSWSHSQTAAMLWCSFLLKI